jgi:L-glutamine-phosphate cytidylyltransferase
MQRHDPASDRAQVRTALLLAAGLGSRLAPLTDALPKCLVPVSGVPILERLVRALDGHGFERLVIVTGYKAETIRDYLGESFGGIAIEYLLSPLFATTNNIYSLWLTRQLIDEAFLLVESDVVFDEPLLAPLLQPGRIAVSRQLPWMSGTTVTLDGNGQVNAFYPPPPGVYGQHCTDAGHFMAVNICSLARDTWGEVCERLDRHVASGRTGSFYETVFEEMAAAGSMAPAAVIFPAERWYEIDTPADLEAAERVFPRRLHVAGGLERRALSAGMAGRAGVAGRAGAPHASIASTQQDHPAAATADPRWSPAAAPAAAAPASDPRGEESPGIRP